MHTLALQTAKVVAKESKVGISCSGRANRNTIAKISGLRREKLVPSTNKSLAPLVKEDSDFSKVAPNLFGLELSKGPKTLWTR